MSVVAVSPRERGASIPAAPLLVARGLTRRFGKRVAVDEVDLALSPGRVVGLLGPNGAGKTTLLSLLAGHLRPTAGEVIWPGAKGERGLRGRLGMLPQGAPLSDDETPRRMLRQLARLQDLTDPDGAVEAVLEATGLHRAATTRLRALSGGDRKLVAVGQAFLGAPRVVLLDEPTSALDPWGRQRLRALVRARRHEGAALLIASHNLGELEQLCDDAIVLGDGRVRSVGTLSNLLRAPDEVRFDIGAAGHIPVQEIRDALPGVRADFDPETQTLVLAGIGRGASASAASATAGRLLGEAGAEVRRVVWGRTLEAALGAVVAGEPRQGMSAGRERAAGIADEASDLTEG